MNYPECVAEKGTRVRVYGPAGPARPPNQRETEEAASKLWALLFLSIAVVGLFVSVGLAVILFTAVMILLTLIKISSISVVRTALPVVALALGLSGAVGTGVASAFDPGWEAHAGHALGERVISSGHNLEVLTELRPVAPSAFTLQRILPTVNLNNWSSQQSPRPFNINHLNLNWNYSTNPKLNLPLTHRSTIDWSRLPGVSSSINWTRITGPTTYYNYKQPVMPNTYSNKVIVPRTR